MKTKTLFSLISMCAFGCSQSTEGADPNQAATTREVSPTKAAAPKVKTKPPGLLAISFVPPGGEDEMAGWMQIDKSLKKQAGYMGSTLLVTQGKSPFTFINLARWKSAEDLKSVLEGKELGQQLKSGSQTAWYSVVDRQGALNESTSGSNIVVVPLEIEESQASDFKKRFAQDKAFLTQMPGFEAFALLVRAGGEAPYNYVLVARWATKADFDTAVAGRGAKNLLRDLPESSKTPGIYFQTTK